MSSGILKKINQKVGFRLVTKFGEKGIINLSKLIPVVGGLETILKGYGILFV
jgi:hypothetical protein